MSDTLTNLTAAEPQAPPEIQQSPFCQRQSQAWMQVVVVIRAHYKDPDVEGVKVIFSCISAHRINEYPPAWLLLIAPPGSLKTAILESLRGLPCVYFVDEVTEKTFISGKLDEKGKSRKVPASYLHRIGKDGVLVAADFGTVMSMERRTRNKILAQLRRIYDGHFSREFGTEEHLEERTWEGRLTFAAGAVPEVDRYHSVFQTLGERFIRTRWLRAGGAEAARKAMGQTIQVSAELGKAVRDFLFPILSQSCVAAPKISDQYMDRIANLSEFTALARADVPRARDGKICGEATAESNTRLPQELAQVGRGWAALFGRGEIGEEEYALIKRAAFDSIPPTRCAVLKALAGGGNPYSIGLPDSTVHVALEDLAVAGVGLVKEGAKGLVIGQASELSPLAKELLAKANLL